MVKNELSCLRETFGEAFYLLDSKRFKNNFVELKECFQSIYPNFNIAYSYKTNYIPKLCKIVNQLGGYAEVVSEMEMELALRCGVAYDKIIWNGPIKKESFLENFLLHGGQVNIDNYEEFKFIKKCIISNLDSCFKLGVRVNYDVEDGVISRFGFDVNSCEFKDVISFISDCKQTKLVSIQCHFAKRQIEYWPARARKMIDLLDHIDLLPERIDLGGGLFGKMPDSLKKQFPYDIPSYIDYAKAVAKIFAEKYGDNGPELIIEPGTAIVGDCMKFIGTIKSIKKVQNKWYATMLGSQKNISMSGVNPPIEIINFDAGKEYDNLDIVGFTCIEGDVIYHNYSGKIGVNDLVIISNCGSYSIVMKPPFILPNFPILDVSNGVTEVIKRAETFDDIFNTYNF